MTTLSKTENKVLMANARDSLKEVWGQAVGALIVYILVFIVIGLFPIIGQIAVYIIAGPLMVGGARFTLAVSRKETPRIGQLFSGFDRFGSHLAAYFLQGLFIALWTLLLIVPGIIATLSYSMTYFIIAEDSSIGASEAITKSKKMMKGNKWKLSCLSFRFTGWFLLGMLSFGIGFLWIGPYIYVSLAKFYDDLKTLDDQSCMVDAEAVTV
ncbi:MAG: DUF975 family protein [Verrucomicrobiota bacterium]|nr:DUF975 family protein [Verrucomicrobiota bacterium]